MSDNLPQIAAILRAIEERLTALMDAQTDPEGRVQQAQNDILRSYGLIAQTAEIMGIQRDQILALSDAIAVLVARFVEHDRKVGKHHREILDLLTTLAHAVGMVEIAANAERARQLLQDEADEAAAELELSADQAKVLLATASMQAMTEVQRAVSHQKDVILQAEIAAREKLSEEANE